MDRIKEFWNKVLDQRGQLLSQGTAKFEKLPPWPEVIARLRVLRYPAFFVGGLLLADLLLQASVTYLIKAPPPKVTEPRVLTARSYLKSRGAYEAVSRKNGFCPGCPVPDMELRAVERPKDCNKAQPFEGNIKLLGTIVLSEKRFSVATVSAGSDSKALMVGDEVPGAGGKIFDIRRNKLCFTTRDGALRFVEIPEESGFKFGQPLANTFPPTPSEGITRASDNDIEIKKDFLMAKLADPNVLFQAQAVPEREFEGGPIKCFKLLSMVPGSVYESLGVKVGDCIAEVNGEPMNSITKAQELYSNLKNTSELTIGVIRNGQKSSIRFQVK